MRDEPSESGTDRNDRTDRHDTLPFDPAAAVCEELLVFVDEEDGADIGDLLAADGVSPDRGADEIPDMPPVAASAVVDVEFVIDYDQELGYLRAEGRQGFGARRTGSRGRSAGPQAG